MTLSRLFFIAVLVGTVGVIGCGNDGGGTAGSGGTGGTGGTGGSGGTTGEGCEDPDTFCADCPAGAATDDCKQDVGICNQFDPPSRCEACINATNPGCDGAGGTSGTGGSTGEGCADADTVCDGCAEGQPLNDCQADVALCNQFDPPSRCQACIDQTNPECQ